MKDIVFITGNAGKVAEMSRLLGVEVQAQKLELPEIQSADVREVARAKAQAAYDMVGRPVLVDDTGLTIRAWGQLPGAFIAWFLGNVGCDGITRMMQGWDDRSAYVTTALGYCDQHGVRIFDGQVAGRIAQEPRGTNGLGYDPIFIPDGSDKTFAQMTPAEKDAVSMRAIAAAKLREHRH